MKKMVCIVCPRGCRLTVDTQTLEVSGNFCPRGAEYGKNEVTNPVRTVTATVDIEGAAHPRLPVRTDKPIPKHLMMEVMAEVHRIKAASPVEKGQILIKNVCGTDANIIASRSM